MSDYCSQCSPFAGKFEIDLAKIALKLKPGRSESFICEGCNNRAVYKDENNNLFLAKMEKGEIKLHPIDFEQLI
jgi:hypothetical protein